MLTSHLTGTFFFFPWTQTIPCIRLTRLLDSRTHCRELATTPLFSHFVFHLVISPRLLVSMASIGNRSSPSPSLRIALIIKHNPGHICTFVGNE